MGPQRTILEHILETGTLSGRELRPSDVGVGKGRRVTEVELPATAAGHINHAVIVSQLDAAHGPKPTPCTSCMSFRVERSQHFTQRINLREILSVRVVQPRDGELHILYYKVVRHEQRPVHLAVVGDANVGSQLNELFPFTAAGLKVRHPAPCTRTA